MRAWRNRLLLGMGAFHLILVAAGAASLDYSGLPGVGKALGYYGAVSGTSSSYGFFSEPIGTEVRARFEIIDQAGNKTTTGLGSASSHEADLRILGIMGEFRNTSVEDPQRYRRSLAASLAGSLFGRYPDAKSVVVRLEEYSPVNMEQYRLGQRSKWVPIYELEFEPESSSSA